MLAEMRRVRRRVGLVSLVAIAGCAAPRPAADVGRGWVVDARCPEPGCEAVRGRGARVAPADDRQAIERWRGSGRCCKKRIVETR